MHIIILTNAAKLFRCKTDMAQGKYFQSMYVRITADGYNVTVDDGCAMRDTHVHTYVCGYHNIGHA